MTPQDFKALLDALNRISEAIEGKSGKRAETIVNRFAEVFRQLQHLRGCNEAEKWLVTELDKIIKTYSKIAEEVLNENS